MADRDELFPDEDAYFAVREEQLVRSLRRSGHTRRQIVEGGLARARLLAGAGHRAGPPAARIATPRGPIVKPLPAEHFIVHGTNAEMRWEAARELGDHIPGDRFFVRNHTSTPLIDADGWSLKLWGDGLRGAPTLADPIRLGYEELTALPSVEVSAVIECAGNGRSFFARQQGTAAAGTQWGLGAVGAARWRGVPLGDVLERAGLAPGAVDVMPVGLDPNFVVDGVDHGAVRRPLPIGKALHDAILAYELNGESLPPDHGYPMRLIVPGWVGVASIKWVGQIQVSRTPLYSYWNEIQYVLQGPDHPTRPPVGVQMVKSAFELGSPAVLPHARQTLTGRSWSGRGPIREVQISTDDGASWIPARLRPATGARGWVRWEVPWAPPRPGSYTLRARATDQAGQTQPATVPFNSLGYFFWATVKHPVTVSP